MELRDGYLLGAYADYAGAKKRLLAVFLGIGVSATAAMFFIGRGQWQFGALLFMLSDSVLGTRKFLLKNAPARVESVVMATYTAAQFLLSEGAARAGRPA